jgi:cell wall-associated NlpC family hydrolase
VPDWLENIRLTGESIVATARKFVGVPYLWGGTSAKSVDCSGFVKSVYFMHGIILARDASQQARYGKLVDTAGDFSKTEPGDLVFFGRRGDEQNPTESVVHVGIYIGNNRFIHASDYVHISSFDPNDPLYDAYNTNRYLRTKRILGEINTEGVEEILLNEFYR